MRAPYMPKRRPTISPVEIILAVLAASIITRRIEEHAAIAETGPAGPS